MADKKVFFKTPYVGTEGERTQYFAINSAEPGSDWFAALTNKGLNLTTEQISIEEARKLYLEKATARGWKLLGMF